MAITGYGFEDLAEGQSIPEGAGNFFNTGVTTPGQTAEARASAAYTGNRGMYLENTSSGTQNYLEQVFATPTGSASYTMMFKQTTPLASGQMRNWAFTTSTGGAPVRLDHHSDGRFLVRNAAATTIPEAQTPNSAAVPPLGTWVMWQVWAKKGTTTTNGQLHAVMTRMDTNTVIFDSGLLTNVNTGTADYSGFLVGWGFNTTTAITTYEADDIALDTAPADNTLLPPYTGPSNTPPTVSAGADQANIEPYTTVTLTGTATDPGGTIASRTWRQVSGTPTVTLTGATTATATYKAPGTLNGTTLVFGFTATDDGGATATEDTTTHTILPVTERAVIGGVEVPMEIRAAVNGVEA